MPGWRPSTRSKRSSTTKEIECEWVAGPGLQARAARRSADDEAEAQRLREEAALAAELGFDAAYVDAVPFFGTPGVEVANQAKFHPRKYLAALATLIDGDGSHVFEHSESERDLPTRRSRVKANGHTITCGHVVDRHAHAADGQGRA